jgi:cytochrome c
MKRGVWAMKNILLSAVLSAAFMPLCFGADPGEIIFRANRCGVCHKAEGSTSNPSLKDISLAYRGRVDRLQKYLQGESEPIINLGRAGIMKRYVEKTKALSASERKTLADYLVSH